MPRILPVLLLLVAACAARDANIAADAQLRLIGLMADDLRLCSGVPDRRESSDGGEFWTYNRTPPSSGISLPVPITGGSMSMSSAGVCSVTFQLIDGRVTRIGYSAATEFGMARDSACAPVVQGCLRMVENGSVRTR
ncbi:MAG: hypothetical protein JWO26_415 [Rhodospirillales bacterium]|nr:hypothetical protein [Rhodospirillales bacterium]